jgi:FAD:protein FMN transferase
MMWGRRRFLRVLAAMPGVVAASHYGLAQDGIHPRAPRLSDWRGSALGADAQIQIAHEDEIEASKILVQCQAEINAIENLFSLYREDSVLSQLNAVGAVADASKAFTDLLNTSKDMHSVTSGYFDPSVQSLWQVYAAAAKSQFTDEKNLFREIAISRDQIGFQDVDISASYVKLGKSGMALTMNGIAQGYLTDKIVAILRNTGVGSALVETGETYGLGNHPKGRMWRLGVPELVARGKLTRVISLEDRAVATSAPSGTIFERTGRFHHLFDPHTGKCTSRWSNITVAAPSAALADGLSTAFSAMPRKMILDTVQSLPDVGVHLVGMDGAVTEFGMI